MARADGIVGVRYDEKPDAVDIATCKCVQIAVEIATCKPTEGNVY